MLRPAFLTGQPCLEWLYRMRTHCFTRAPLPPPQSSNILYVPGEQPTLYVTGLFDRGTPCITLNAEQEEVRPT